MKMKMNKEQAKNVLWILGRVKGSPKANLSSLIRKETHEGDEYLVSPAILIREGVHNGVLYNSEQLSKFPEAWDGRPVVVHHPVTLQGHPKSANSLAVDTERTIGKIYNTRWDSSIRGLRSEVWINTRKCRALAGDIIARLEANQNLEVSTGLFTDDILEGGKWNDETYSAIATNYRPDHLAVLPDGVGACSWADGAGMPRVNQQKILKNHEQEEASKVLASMVENVVHNNSGKEYIMDRNIAVTALIASGAWEEGDVEFLKTMEESKFTKLVTMAGLPPWLKKGAKKDEEEMSDEDEAAAAEEAKKAKANEAVPAVVPPAPVSVLEAKTLDEVIASAPKGLQADLRRAVDADKVMKQTLVDTLKANARCKFTQEQLASKDVSELQNLVDLASVEKTDFSGRNAGEHQTALKANDNMAPAMPALFAEAKK